MQTIPVLKLGPILLVSVQTELNDRVASDLQEAVLRQIRSTGASGLMIDITAMSVVDSYIARVLGDTAKMAQTMATDVVLIGMQPAVALTLLEMGLELPDIDTALNVDLGLEALGYQLTRKPVNGARPPHEHSSKAA